MLGYVFRIWVLLLSLTLPTASFSDTFGEWQFSPPDGYEHEVTRWGMTYKGPAGVFFFTESQPANGQALAALAPPLIEEATGVPASDQRYLETVEPEEGLEVAFYLAVDDSAAYFVGIFKRHDRFAAALFITGQADVEAEQQALIETVFNPTQAPTAPARTVTATWPAPLTSPIVSTRPRMSVYQAEVRQLDPEHVPILGDFSCFIVDEPRPMTPDPDVTVTFAALGYSVTDGQNTAQGRWWVEADDTFDRVVRLDGVLEAERYIVMHEGPEGQSFRIDNPYSTEEQELLCLQAGPAVEIEVQRMARVAVSGGLMQCADAEGKAFNLAFGSGIYSLPEGKGYVELWLQSYSGGTWTGIFNFTSGPLSLYDGEISSDGDGLIKLVLTTEWSEGSMFYSSTETTTHAICTMKSAARPLPIYGQDPSPAAAAAEGGLPEGLYQSFEGRYVYYGLNANYVFSSYLTYVGPDGRILRDAELGEIGDLPDCSRTRPDGYGFCGEYKITGGMIRFRDEGYIHEEDWSEFSSFKLTETGYAVDGIAYNRLQPVDASTLPGIWVADSYTGGGPGAGGGVGVYTDAEVYWNFTADGRFEWSESSSTQTLITPDPILGGVSGGGSSSAYDSGTGTYRVDGLWLELTFTDGRKKRVTLVMTVGEDPALEIDGASLKKE